MNKKAIPINAINISKLRGMLGYGDLKKIAEKTGYTQQYVGKVLDHRNPRSNKKIIQEAVKLAQNSMVLEVSDQLANEIV